VRCIVERPRRLALPPGSASEFNAVKRSGVAGGRLVPLDGLLKSGLDFTRPT